MLPNIIAFEEELSRLLPEYRTDGRPGAELLSLAERWSQAVWQAAEDAGPWALDSADVTNGLCLSEKPVFVCGAHRSGTTLTRDLLDGHPQLSVLPSEGSYFTSLRGRLDPLPREEKLAFAGREWLRRLANPINQAPYWLLGRTTDRGSPYVTFARMLMAWWPEVEKHFGTSQRFQPLIAVALAYTSSLSDAGIRADLQRWAEKTPTNEFYLDQLSAQLPSARVIQLVRDPSAVYASRKRLEERSLGAFRGARTALQDLARSLEIAAEEESMTRRGGGRSHHLVVRYEDLVRDPEETMRRVAVFLEIAWDARLLVPTVAGIPTRPNSAFGQPETPGAILNRAPDGHEVRLTDWESELVTAYTGHAAAALGYPARELTDRRKRMVKLRFRLSEALAARKGR